MKITIRVVLALATAFVCVLLTISAPLRAQVQSFPARPQGPCDIYAAAHDPCVAAHSTTRALLASFKGPLYQVMRQSDGRKLNIDVVAPSVGDAGGYADAAAQDRFCANTYCWIAIVYDQSGHGNDLTQAPRGRFLGPAMGGLNNLPIADMAPVTIMGHKAYGVFIAPGMGLRQNNAKGTAVDDQAEGQYWVINGRHFNAGCCFDYGNAETDSHDDDNGTMETTYYGDATPWYHGTLPGPWVMTDQENNLVGCVNPDGTKFCAHLPNISWRFVSGMAKGEPHHWISLGGDATKGALRVMFDGPRVNATYDPMRKQGAILLGNGGDNSNSSQGTFYEGAMTAAGTFPSDATDQRVQANVVAAGYGEAPLSLAPAAAVAAPPGLQVFAPESSQQTTVTFTNTSRAAARDAMLRLILPAGWSATVTGTHEADKSFTGLIAPGAQVSATFTVTSGTAAFNGDLVAQARWTDPANGRGQTETAAEKVRNVSPVRINEFRVSDGSANLSNSFIELYNASATPVDLSRWTLTQHPTEQANFSVIEIPAGAVLKPRGFYLLGLANSGLAEEANAGAPVIHVRSTAGLKVGDTIRIGTGPDAETRTIARLGTAAGQATTVWQPMPDGPIVTLPAGATNIPVTSTEGFAVGEKVALGHGATYPVAARGHETYEIATVTAVGKQGTQAYLGADAKAGDTTIQATSVDDISKDDRIRLDIASVGHGIESVTVTHVGTAAIRTMLSADARAGATKVMARSADGLTVGQKITIGTPANPETVTITSIGAPAPAGTGLGVTPLAAAHINGEGLLRLGTGLTLAAPLKFNHAANMPFSARGTGISFAPAAAFAHASDEPVLPLGTGITLDTPLARAHAIDTPVRDAAVTVAGYQDKPAPDQWFGGPALSPAAGTMILRDGKGLVVDSLNYGLLVEPWAAQGYQAKSAAEEAGCRVTAPGAVRNDLTRTYSIAVNASAGRLPDGADTASNCTDFATGPGTTLPKGAAVGMATLKVASVTGFAPGQTVHIGTGADRESAVITTVGSSGITTIDSATAAGATMIPVASIVGFGTGQALVIDDGTHRETTTVLTATRTSREGARIVLTRPLSFAHAAGVTVTGTGIGLASGLSRAHDAGTQISLTAPTPGAPNRYSGTRPVH